MNYIILNDFTKDYEEITNRLNSVIKNKIGKAAEHFASLKDNYVKIFNQLIDAIHNSSDDIDVLIAAFDRENAELKALLSRIEKYDAPMKKLIHNQKIRDDNIGSVISFLQQELKLPLKTSEDINTLSEAISTAMHEYEKQLNIISFTKIKKILARLNNSLIKTHELIEEVIRDDTILSALSYDISHSSNVMTFKDDCNTLQKMVEELKCVSTNEDWKKYHSPKMWTGLLDDDVIEMSMEELINQNNDILTSDIQIKILSISKNDFSKQPHFLTMLIFLKEGWNAVFPKEIIASFPRVPHKAVFQYASEEEVNIQFNGPCSHFLYFVYVVEFCLKGKPYVDDYYNKVHRALNILDKKGLFCLN